jgi:IclR family transcriptional regulator, KDG regulon repressor
MALEDGRGPAAFGLNRTMTYRLLRALNETAYVTHDPVQKRFRLGLRLLQIGAAIADRLETAAIARPLLSTLPEGTPETVNLGLLHGHEIG